MFLVKNPGKFSTLESKSGPTKDPTVFETPKPTKAQSKKSKHKIHPLKLHESFMGKM